MLTRFIVLLPAIALAMACATAPQLAPVPADHPASPQVPEAPTPPPSQTLREEPQDAARTSAPEHGMHGMESPSPGAPGGAHAQTIYTCPMHPEVRLPEPGTCPKCGMKLVKKEGAK